MSLWTHVTQTTRNELELRIDLHCFPCGDIDVMFPSLGDSARVCTHQHDDPVINSALIHMDLLNGHVSSVIMAVSACVGNS